MDHFVRRGKTLYAEDVALAEIAAKVGTPCYVYSRATLERHWRAFDDALAGTEHLICYSVKALSNLAVLNVLARLGSGFDVVSVGELERVLAAGGDPARTVFSGVGKRPDEMARALEVGIAAFNVESQAELECLAQVAKAHGVRAPFALRVNPDVDANTHPYISTGLKDNKFGVAHGEAVGVYRAATEMDHIDIVGIDCHIGSQLTEIAPFVDALDRVLELMDQLETVGITLSHLDIGGGLGIRYRDEVPPEPRDYIGAVRQRLGGRSVALHVEPGRAIAGNAGVLLTQVEYLKGGEDKHFAVVDGAMNDYIRPSLYQAWCEITPVEERAGTALNYDVVGPVCESADFLGKERSLVLESGDLLAVRSAGAYGFGMSSNYNSRPRVAEVMVDADRFQVIRPREQLQELFATERMLSE
ncbi:MAG: diaminopimelate decarboxylase [Chromatiales bacterium]|jgi:diaminopimelate decarboxylase|nr:diaminopimelate decarboxylase [Chromatiales bacterium]